MSTLIRDPNKNFPYRDDDWPEDTLWTFRQEQTSDDRDLVQRLTTRSILGKIDRKEFKRRLASRQDTEEYVSEHTTVEFKMSTEQAMLAVMGVSVEGEGFMVPADLQISPGKPDPYAGKLIPQPPAFHLRATDPKRYEAELTVHTKYLGLIDPDARTEALTFMTGVWAARSPEDLARFPKGSVGMGRSADDSGRKSKASVPA